MTRSADKNTPLTGKQKKFADLYVGECNMNAVRAAERAGYKGNYATLGSIGYENLRKPHIRAYIDERMSQVAATKSEILEFWTRQMRTPIGDLLNDDGSFDLEEVKRRGLDGLIKNHRFKKRIDLSTNTHEISCEVEMYDAQKASVNLAKAYQMFTDKIEVSGPAGAPLIPKDISLTIESIYGGNDAQSSDLASEIEDDRDSESGGDAEGSA